MLQRIFYAYYVIPTPLFDSRSDKNRVLAVMRFHKMFVLRASNYNFVILRVNIYRPMTRKPRSHINVEFIDFLSYVTKNGKLVSARRWITLQLSDDNRGFTVTRQIVNFAYVKRTANSSY